MGEFDFVVEETKDQRYNRENRASRQIAWKKKNDRRGEARRQAFLDKEFTFWDGEGSSVPDGTPQPYMLFGNSDGEEIAKPQLGTEECLALIADADPAKIHVSFAFGYDCNQLLWELPSGKLFALSSGRSTCWKKFVIEWVNHKWLAVRWNRKGARRIQIYDTFHFFNCSFVAALEKFQIGTAEERAWLAEEKARRPQFAWEEIEQVKEYFRVEGRLGVALMAHLKELFFQAGIYPTSWHGPGAVAREMMKSHGVKNAQKNLRESDLEVWIAARYGYAAGRFQQFLAGLYEGAVYNWDIHSAYPYAIQFLPDLNKGFWERIPRVDRRKINPTDFAIYHIRYDSRSREKNDIKYRNRPRPLFRRLKNDNIFWPDKVEGWYWSPEASLVADDPAATFVEAWIFRNDGSRPLNWIGQIYRTREYHKRLGNAIEYPFKLGMNSCYGQFCQRAGWQRYKGPPPFHQLEWGGFITSMCRMMVQKAAAYAYEHDGLITIDTDGIFSTVRVPEEYLMNGIGDDLGQWEENVYTGILIWQNGFYWLRDSGGEWKKCRSRGAPRGQVDISKAWEALPTLGPIHYSKKIYTGFRYALQTDYSRWRSWQTIPHENVFGGTGKSQHSPRGCPKCSKKRFGFKPGSPGWTDVHEQWADRQLHTLFSMPIGYGEYTGKYPDSWSYMHHLPWLEMEARSVEPQIDPEFDMIWKDDAL